MKKVAFLGMSIAALVFVSGLLLPAGASAQSTTWSWKGLYIGGNVGAARNHDTGVISCINPTGVLNGPGCPIPAFGSANGNGGIAGGQLGYNWQFNRIVVGPEVDLQTSTVQARSTFNGTVNCIGGGSSPVGYTSTNNITTLSTERLRLGFLASPKALIYVTGGLAQGQVNLKSSFQPASGPGTQNYPLNVSVQTHGFIEGVGGEMAVTQKLSAKLEVMMFNLRNVIPYAFAAPGVTAGYQTGKDFEFHGALVRLGFNWKI